jgi:hypothetical protein
MQTMIYSVECEADRILAHCCFCGSLIRESWTAARASVLI